MTSTGAVAGVAFLAYLEHPLAPRPRPGQIVVLDRLGGAPQTGGAGGDRSAGVRVGAVAWVRPGLQPQRVGFQQDRGVRESCGGEDEGERWTLRSRLRWGRCRWGMWWVGLSMPESRITHCENRCKEPVCIPRWVQPGGRRCGGRRDPADAGEASGQVAVAHEPGWLLRLASTSLSVHAGETGVASGGARPDRTAVWTVLPAGSYGNWKRTYGR